MRLPDEKLLTNIVDLLESAPLTVKELAHHLKVPPRKIYRYFRVLEDRGVLFAKVGTEKTSPFRLLRK